MTEPKPVILDTDIGGDIDDTWALALLLKCPELKPVLVASDAGYTAEDAAARPVDVAMAWENLDAYHEWLEARFLAPTVELAGERP